MTWLVQRMAACVILAAAVAMAPPVAGQETGVEAAVGLVVDRLEAFIAEERAAQAGEGELDPETQAALRDSLSALVAAGRLDGLDLRQIERRLAYQAIRRIGRDVPPALSTPSGRLDTAALLASTGVAAAPPSSRDYLSAIAQEGAGTTVGGADAPAPTPVAPQDRVAAAPEPEPEPEPEPDTPVFVRDGVRYWRVDRGDTLTSIALQVYGDVLSYRELYVANRARIANPNLLLPGLELRLPN